MFADNLFGSISLEAFGPLISSCDVPSGIEHKRSHIKTRPIPPASKQTHLLKACHFQAIGFVDHNVSG
jgi:hypothetical protein